MKNHEKIVLISLIGLSSCLVMINENDYRGLTKNDFSHIKSFDLDDFTRQVNYADSFYIYEINSNNIVACARTSRFLWVHLWRPFCKSNTCQNINFYQTLADRYKANGLNLLFISESYDLKSIKNAVDSNGFNRPIYVLQDSYYGHDLNDARKKFSEMIYCQIQDPDLILNDDYVFKDSVVIFACKEINKMMIDGILSVKIDEN